jgi:hypothetical protein
MRQLTITQAKGVGEYLLEGMDISETGAARSQSPPLVKSDDRDARWYPPSATLSIS